MRLDASDIAAGKVGSDSNWYKSVNLEGMDGSLPFYLQSTLYSESLFRGAIYHFHGSDRWNVLYLKNDFLNNLPIRLSYYSPNFMGLKLGVSYAPSYKDDLFESSYQNNTPRSASSARGKSRSYPNLADYKGYSVQTGDLKLIGNAFVPEGALKATVNASKYDDCTVNKGAAYTPNGRSVNGVANLYVSIGASDDKKAGADVDLKNVAIKGETGIEMYTSDTIKAIVEDVRKVMREIDAELTGVETRLDNVENTLGLQPSATSYTNFIGPRYENIFSGGISYEYDARDFKFKLSATGETGAATAVSDLRPALYTGYTLFNDLLAFNLGAKIEYKGFRAVASYANLDKSGVLLGNYVWDAGSSSYLPDLNSNYLPQKSTYYWTLGAGYEYREAYFSATYFYSDKNDGNVLKDFALGAQCGLAFGNKAQFTPYVSWHYFTTKTAVALPEQFVNNEGSVILIGVKFYF